MELDLFYPSSINLLRKLSYVIVTILFYYFFPSIFGAEPCYCHFFICGLCLLRAQLCSPLTIHTSPPPEIVSIAMEMTLRPLLGSSLSVPCNLKTGNDPEATTMAPQSHQIRWTYVSENKITLVLVALDGKIHVAREYRDRVTLVNYSQDPTDATMEIQELRSKDSGTYRCVYGNDEIYDSVNIEVQGTTLAVIKC